MTRWRMKLNSSLFLWAGHERSHWSFCLANGNTRIDHVFGTLVKRLGRTYKPLESNLKIELPQAKFSILDIFRSPKIWSKAENRKAASIMIRIIVISRQKKSCKLCFSARRVRNPKWSFWPLMDILPSVDSIADYAKYLEIMTHNLWVIYKWDISKTQNIFETLLLIMYWKNH